MIKQICVLIFILNSYQVQACKVAPIYKAENEKNIKFLDSFLDDSFEIYTGKIVNDGNNKFEGEPIQVFVTRKIWLINKRAHVYNVKKWYKNELNTENNSYGEFDFVSSSSGALCPSYNKARKQIPNKNYFYMGNNLVQYTIPIESAIPLINKLAKSKTFWGNVNPSWQFCKLDKDCKKIKSKCGSDISINRKYESDYLSFLSSTDSQRIDCKNEVEREIVAIKNKCIDYFCE